MYDTINGWTKETMVEHIKKEFKGKSVKTEKGASEEDLCVYRGPEGKKCAVGMFIPDDKYDKKIEGLGVRHMDLRYIWQYLPLNNEAMNYLQAIHDKSVSDETLIRMLTWIEANVN